jgi:short-subunit dehydrogenase
LPTFPITNEPSVQKTESWQLFFISKALRRLPFQFRCQFTGSWRSGALSFLPRCGAPAVYYRFKHKMLLCRPLSIPALLLSYYGQSTWARQVSIHINLADIYHYPLYCEEISCLSRLYFAEAYGILDQDQQESSYIEEYMDLNNKVIIITGASAGIGKATTEALAEAGANVVLVARREERLQAIMKELATLPGKRLVVAGDIRQERFAYELVERAVDAFGRLDILINNAGLGHRSMMADMPPDDMRTIIETNVLGLLFVSQAALQHMRRQGSGQIVNVSSIAGQRPLPNSALYSASKTAVNFLSRSLRMEWRRYNIKVTTVYPGLTRTEFGQARLGQKGVNRFGLQGVPAERVARKIVWAIQYGRTEVCITWYGWLFVHLNRLFPRLTDWIITRGSHLA